jgi:hypothetical protein
MTLIQIGSAAELPPGKGKVIEVAGRPVTVCNMDGRYTATAPRHTAVLHGLPNGTHVPHGAPFEVYAEDSPARTRADDEVLTVRVDRDTLWLELP